MKKIAIDISPLNNGNSIRGVGYYTKNLVAALEHETKTNPDFKNYQINLINNSSENMSRYDLVHYPYFDPFSRTLPSKKPIPTIITIHDLIPIQFKKHFPVGLKGSLNWLIQKNNAKKADYIITVSHYSKYIISDYLHYPAHQIYVTYQAADKSFKPSSNTQKLTTIKHKYHLPDKFILYVGDINWNKNIPNLVTACLELNYPLVIVGSAATRTVPKHPWTKDILWLQSMAKKLQNSPDLTLTGFVPDEDLPSIFNLATLYCQPSYAEGFGLPVIQAMQSGTPIVFSQETSLPEIMDFNGEYFDPYIPDSLKKALNKLWENPKLRNQYIKSGLKHATTFDWKYTALQTLAVYQLALDYGK